MIKTLFIISTIVIAALLSSCSGGYSCPTYSKKNIKSIEKIEQERV